MTAGTGRVVRSVAAIASSKVLATLSAVVLVPLYLACWPADLYGEWLALGALVAYLSTLDLGMNMGAVNRLTQAYARGDHEDYRRAQGAALGFYLVVAAAGTVLLGALAWAAPLGEWLGLVRLGRAEAAWTSWLLGCFVVWSMAAGFVSATYRSTGDLATSQWIENGQRLLVLIGTVAVLALGGGPVALAWLQLGILAGVTGLVLLRLRRTPARLCPSLGGWDWPTLSSMLAPSLFFVLVLAAGAIAIQGSVVLVSATLGGVAVAVFVTSRTLANVIRQLVNVLVISVWPELTRLDARGDVRTLRSTHSLLVTLTSAGCIAFAAALWWEGGGLVTAWTRGALAADTTTLRLLLASLVVQSPWVVGFVFIAAANRPARASLAMLGASVIGLVLAVALVRPWGTAGVVVGLLVGELVACCHPIVRESCRLVEEAYRPFAWRLWSNLALVSAVALLAGWAAHAGIGAPAPIRWAAVGTATTAVTAVMTWLWWLTPDDRETLARRLRPLVATVSDAKA
jgi:O-antigen/teichoic acid export membrane protein